MKFDRFIGLGFVAAFALGFIIATNIPQRILP